MVSAHAAHGLQRDRSPMTEETIVRRFLMPFLLFGAVLLFALLLRAR
jgi:hypothetical protein